MQKAALILLVSFFTIISCKQEKRLPSSVQINANAIQATRSGSVSSQSQLKTQIGAFNSSKKVIRNANIQYKIENLDKALIATKDLINSFEGYISNEQEYMRNNRKEIKLNIKVPATSFESFIDSLTQINGNYESRNINISDVTERYIDIETRLQNKRLLENKYQNLLKKSTKVEDLLAVEENLEKVSSEIESIEKRFNALKNDINYSQVKVQFYKYSNAYSTSYRYNMLDEIWHSLKRGWNGVVRTVLFIFSLWPFIFIAPLIYFLLKKYIIKWYSRKSKQTL